MKAYFPVQDINPSRPETLASIKSVFEKQFIGFKIDPVFSLSYDREDQFFLKAQHAILWGKVFFEPFTLEKAAKLKAEQVHLGNSFQQQVQLHIFFSKGDLDPARMKEYPLADFYHYSFIQSSGEKAMLMERISFLQDTTLAPSENFPASGRSEYNFSRQSKLSPTELAELIDLSLELKRA